MRNKVVDHGDLTYYSAYLGVALAAQSRIEYLEPLYVTVPEWLNARDLVKFFFIVRYVKKRVKQELENERERLTSKYKGTVPDDEWYVGEVITEHAFNMLSEVRIQSLHKLHKEAEIDETDTDIEVCKSPPRPGKGEVQVPCSMSIHRYDSRALVNIKWAASRPKID